MYAHIKASLYTAVLTSLCLYGGLGALQANFALDLSTAIYAPIWRLSKLE